jgi:hypothetical protein
MHLTQRAAHVLAKHAIARSLCEVTLVLFATTSRVQVYDMVHRCGHCMAWPTAIGPYSLDEAGGAVEHRGAWAGCMSMKHERPGVVCMPRRVHCVSASKRVRA